MDGARCILLDKMQIQFGIKLLQTGQSFYLVAVTAATKGSPGKPGFTMFVAEDSFRGTVGGGIMEFQLVKELKKNLGSNPKKYILRTLYHNKKAPLEKQSGLICAGSQTINCILFEPDQIDMLVKCLGSIESRQNAWLLFTSNGLEWTNERKNRTEYPYQLQLRIKPLLVIVGAGHVGGALATAALHLDFEIICFDHRPIYEYIPEGVTLIVDKYANIPNLIKDGSNVFCCVVSTSMLHDIEALEALIPILPQYVGVMGSDAKLQKIYSSLIAKGFFVEDLAKIRAPIGVSMKSASAEEIAISILAEVIQAKNLLGAFCKPCRFFSSFRSNLFNKTFFHEGIDKSFVAQTQSGRTS